MKIVLQNKVFRYIRGRIVYVSCDVSDRTKSNAFFTIISSLNCIREEYKIKRDK